MQPRVQTQSGGICTRPRGCYISRFSQGKCSSWASSPQNFACGACNGYVTVRKRSVFVFCWGGPGPSDPGGGDPLNERSKTLRPVSCVLVDSGRIPDARTWGVRTRECLALGMVTRAGSPSRIAVPPRRRAESRNTHHTVTEEWQAVEVDTQSRGSAKIFLATPHTHYLLSRVRGMQWCMPLRLHQIHQLLPHTFFACSAATSLTCHKSQRCAFAASLPASSAAPPARRAPHASAARVLAARQPLLLIASPAPVRMTCPSLTGVPSFELAAAALQHLAVKCRHAAAQVTRRQVFWCTGNWTGCPPLQAKWPAVACRPCATRPG